MYIAKAWEDLWISDDYMFAKVMRDKALCKTMLERLLHIKVKDLEYVEEQKTIDISYDAKSVRLDVYVEDDDRVFNIEMQTTNQKELAKRSRYYQGMIDLNTIEKGESYRKLKESYVIFICTFDPFGLGRVQYRFENLCLEDNSLHLGDGAKKVFFNTSDYAKSENAELRALLRYIDGKSDNPDKDCFVQELDDRMERVRENKEWRTEYMTLLMREQEIREEAEERGVKKGRAEGIAQNRIEMVLEMLKEGIDISLIATISKLSEKEILALKSEHAL